MEQKVKVAIQNLHEKKHRAEIDTLKAELALEKEKLKVAKKEVESMKLEKKTIQSVSGEPEKQANELRLQISELQGEVLIQREQYEKKTKKTENELVAAKSEIENLRKQLQSYDNTVSMKDNQIQNQQDNISKMVYEHQTQLRKISADHMKQYSELQKEYASKISSNQMPSHKLHDPAPTPELSDEHQNTAVPSSQAGSASQTLSGEQRPKPPKRTVLVLGNSQTKHINAIRLAPECTVDKEDTYTIQQAVEYVQQKQPQHDIIVLHLISNDVKTADPESVKKELDSLIDSALKLRPDTQVVISLAPPRCDDGTFHSRGQLVNALVQHMYHNHARVSTVDNSNLGSRGDPSSIFYKSDGIHLTSRGAGRLAFNIRIAICARAGLPAPYGRKRKNHGDSSSAGFNNRGNNLNPPGRWHHKNRTGTGYRKNWGYNYNSWNDWNVNNWN